MRFSERKGIQIMTDIYNDKLSLLNIETDDLKNIMQVVKKYSLKTCPQSDTWFANGGRCGWAKVCRECQDNRPVLG